MYTKYSFISEGTNESDYTVLFDGRTEVLHQKMDRLLRRRYEDNTGDDYLKISFVLGGIMYTGHLTQEDRSVPPEELYRKLAELIRRL